MHLEFGMRFSLCVRGALALDCVFAAQDEQKGRGMREREKNLHGCNFNGHSPTGHRTGASSVCNAVLRRSFPLGAPMRKHTAHNSKPLMHVGIQILHTSNPRICFALRSPILTQEFGHSAFEACNISFPNNNGRLVPFLKQLSVAPRYHSELCDVKHALAANYPDKHPLCEDFACLTQRFEVHIYLDCVIDAFWRSAWEKV